MKKTLITTVALIFAASAAWVLLQQPTDEASRAFAKGQPIKAAKHKQKLRMAAAATGVDLSEEGDRSSLGYASWFRDQRVYPADSYPRDAMKNAFAHIAANNLGRAIANDETRTSRGLPRAGGSTTFPWEFIGPSTLPDGQTDTDGSIGYPLSNVSGRTQAIAVHPGNSDIVYAGGAQGGVWKTTNATAATPAWTPLTDQEATLATGSIAIDPSNPDIIYVGTGEPAGSCDSYYGQGILRSTDAGDTWSLLAQPTFQFKSISKILVDPASAGSTTTTTVFASVRVGLFSSGTSQCAAASGAVTGGVYRSTDSGQTWTLLNVPTGVGGTQQVHDMSFGATGATLYAAVRGFGAQDTAGIWKSTNALSATPTFTRMANGYAQTSNATPSSPETRRSRMAVCEGTPDTIYTAVEALGSTLWGMFKTTDGGANWSHMDGSDSGTANYSSGSTTVSRLSGPNFIASMIGQRIILDGRMSRTVASITNINTLELTSGTDAAGSADSWSVASYPSFCDGQCFYNLTAGCDPSDSDVLYIGGNPRTFAQDLGGVGVANRLSAWRSDDGGDSWTGISHGDNVTGGIHTDVQSVAFDSSTKPSRVFVGTDGGVWSSDNEGGSWKSMNTDLAITQFQGVALHPSDTGIVLGGTQDNGTNILRTDLEPAPAFFHTDFGDGGQAIIDQGDGDRMFHTYFNQTNAFQGPARSTTGGDDGPGGWTFVGGYFGYGAAYQNGFIAGDPVLFYAPLAQFEGTDPNPVYFGTNKVFRSPDPAPAVPAPPLPGSWTAVSPNINSGDPTERVSWIEVFPALISGDEVVYAGGAFGSLMVAPDIDGTTSGCPGACTSTWNQIADAAVTPSRFVTDIEVSRGDATANTAYVTFSGFNASTPATPGHVFKTVDGLAGTPTWMDISGNLPDIPANAIAVDHTTSPEKLYVGTDIGVFSSSNGGSTWIYENQGHPAAAVFGLDRSSLTGQLVSSTHGRGMFEANLDIIFTDGFESGNTSVWSNAVP